MKKNLLFKIINENFKIINGLVYYYCGYCYCCYNY